MSVRKLILFFSVILLMISCSKSVSEFPEKSFRSRLVEADNHIGWGLNYFDSWQKGLQPRYLKLAEKHTITAINMFAHLEYDTSPLLSNTFIGRILAAGFVPIIPRSLAAAAAIPATCVPWPFFESSNGLPLL